jgi:hypothetical protein
MAVFRHLGDGELKFMALGYSISFAIIINLWTFRERPDIKASQNRKLLFPTDRCQKVTKKILSFSLSLSFSISAHRLLYLTAARKYPIYFIFI